MEVNIVGAGLAGLSAAISLAEAGQPCRLISLQASERAQSVLAEGGINAALNTMGEGDSPEQHEADTLKGGAFLADPNAVHNLTQAAPEIVSWLCRLGVSFQREQGQIVLRNFGGQKKKRTAYAKSSTGKAMMTALIDEARKQEAAGLIVRFSHHELSDLDIREEYGGLVCHGLTLRDIYTGEFSVFSGPVILCSGGLNGFFSGSTTGTTQNGGLATALALQKGVELGNLEMIQYHPTTVGIPGKRMLVSEAARGEGGRLFVRRDGAPWYFMEEFSELGNLAPRDVISREMVRVLERKDCKGPVYLDLTGLPKQTWAKKLPDLRQELLEILALDPAKEPIPVAPGIHYFMGGILVDEGHRTNARGLYAAGECVCQYHGANRLGGNSMLGAIYGGKTAAGSILADEAYRAEALLKEREICCSPAFSKQLGEILSRGLGILRHEKTLRGAMKELDSLTATAQNKAEQAQVILGRAMLSSALARRESRGAHTRTDYPERNDADFQKTTTARYANGKVEISFRDLPERREDP